MVRRIVESHAPNPIIPFGSYAYGTPTEDSDLDLLIIEENAKKKPIERSLTIRHLLWGGEMPPTDIFARTPQQQLTDGVARIYTIEPETMHKGRILYAAA